MEIRPYILFVSLLLSCSVLVAQPLKLSCFISEDSLYALYERQHDYCQGEYCQSLAVVAMDHLSNYLKNYRPKDECLWMDEGFYSLQFGFEYYHLKEHLIYVSSRTDFEFLFNEWLLLFKGEYSELYWDNSEKKFYKLYLATQKEGQGRIPLSKAKILLLMKEAGMSTKE